MKSPSHVAISAIATATATAHAWFKIGEKWFYFPFCGLSAVFGFALFLVFYGVCSLLKPATKDTQAYKRNFEPSIRANIRNLRRLHVIFRILIQISNKDKMLERNSFIPNLTRKRSGVC